MTLSPKSSADEWLTEPSVVRVVTFAHASPSGRRLGRLSLGIGFDALVLALKTRFIARSQDPLLATNPWIAFALRVFGFKNLFSLGIYATPGSRTWSAFAKMLRGCPMIVMSHVELENWSVQGGRAKVIRYGNTFPYSERADENVTDDDRIRIFIGGSSDRDQDVIRGLSQQVLNSGLDVHLVVATGGPPTLETNDRARVEHLSRLSQVEFGQQLALATVSLLPLKDSGRSAGHMFVVGSLQVGTPVLSTGTAGMNGYFDGVFCRRIGTDVLSEILKNIPDLPSPKETMAYWASEFSRDRYVTQVVDAVNDFRRSGSSV